MDNPSNYIFCCSIPDGYVVGCAYIKFGTQFLTLVINQHTAVYYHIIHDKKNRTFRITELISGDTAKCEYDADGNYVTKKITNNVDSDNVVTKLNKKTNSDSYSPTAATDVATKEYVDSNRCSSVHYVDVTMTALYPDIIVESDTDFEQIETLIDAGVSVVCRLTMPEQFIGVEMIMYSSFYSVVSKQSVHFTIDIPLSSAVQFLRVTFDSDGVSCKELS